MALVGPLVRVLTLPPSQNSVENFVYHLVILIWPTQPLGAYEAAIGTTAALVLSVGANITLFVIVGLVVGVIGERWIVLLVSYA
ncbi:MAG: hypothetical protein OEY28_09855, partial [Nitrospira sp.]|nr:hypothetical protein [Nitrospira sp.]